MDIRGKIKAGWGSHGREIALGGVVFLLVTLAFGVGWFVGTRTLARPPIVVNCPSDLYQQNYTSTP